MNRYLLIVCFLFVTTTAFGSSTIQTGRGEMFIEDGTTPHRVHPKTGKKIYSNTFGEGVIDNLHDVTFIGWAFNQKNPHTVIFTNSTNLTFIDCNLMNVELQEDFTVQSSLTIQVRKYRELGKNYREVEGGDNQTRLYEIIETTTDIIDRDFPLETETVKNRIRQRYIDDDREIFYTTNREEFRTIKETPDAKKIKATRISN